MENVNFIKNIDNLGRIVIPMDIRRKMRINTGDVLSITCDGKYINLAKFNSLINNLHVINILKAFIEVFNLNIVLLNKEKVVFSNIVKNGVMIDNDLSNKVSSGSNIKYDNDGLFIGEKSIDDVYSMMPIVTNEGIIGSIIVFGREESNAYLICQLISKLIMLELNIS